jgi:NAD(P)-dependent dehydrogenase (short-subunit alcohol dehydrogenase family)
LWHARSIDVNLRADTTLRTVDAGTLERLRPQQLFDLTGRTALVTGATGGLGSWLAAGLAAAGAHVVASDHPSTSFDRLAEAIRSAGGAITTVASDLLEPRAPAELIEQVVESSGRIDVLVNNAGINRREPILEVERETWDRISGLNLRVPFELSRAAVQHMRTTGGGSIVHIGSLNNAIGLEGVSVYGAHKAALCQLAKSMAIEWAEHGVRVNALCPGFMLTPLSKPLWDDEVRGGWIVERSLFRRPGYPEELVGCCLLLASDAGSFITGQTYYVEGGWLAGTPWSRTPA